MVMPATPLPRRRGRWRRNLLLLVLVVASGLALWTWATLKFYYAEGNRAGLLQKMSRSGWLCKTQEGELVLTLNYPAGFAPPLWIFSVRDRSVGDQLDQAVGSWVEVHYTEHPGIPFACFARTRYFVDRVTPRPMPYGAQPTAPAVPPTASPAPISPTGASPPMPPTAPLPDPARP